MSHSHLIMLFLVSGVLIVILLFSLVMIYRWKSKKASAFAKYPSIVVTSHDDPKLKEERLWSPQDHSKKIRQGTKSISRVERENKVRSYWFPKRDIKHFLPPITGEYQQPSLSKDDDMVKGRLKFSLSYDYNMEFQRSILTVRLHHGRDYTDGSEDLLMDTFVKTKLLPSKKQIFISKLQRRTLNPNYNETYDFDIDYSEINAQALCFEIFRYDCVSRHEIFGEVIVPLRDIGSNGCNVIKEISMSMNIVDQAEEIPLASNYHCMNDHDICAGESSKIKDKEEDKSCEKEVAKKNG